MSIENPKYPQAQQGFATVLVVLLVGVAVAAATLGTAYYVNTSQKTLISSHALTNAQSGAWTGVEVFRKYLTNLDSAGILSLNGQNLVVKIQGGRELKVDNLVSLETNSELKQYRVSANILNQSEKSGSSSKIQVVYDISLNQDASTGNDNSAKSTEYSGAMNFYGNLDANGGINFSNAGDRAVVNVSGNFNTNSGLSGIKELKVLGDVNIGGGGITGLENIYANGNVTLKASGNASLVSAKGTVTTSGGVSVGDIYADQNVEIGSSGTINSIDTKESIFAGGGGLIKVATAGKNIDIKSKSITTALANSKINRSGGGEYLTYATSGDVFTCGSKNWNAFTLLKAVSFTKCPDTPEKMLKISAGTKVAFPKGALATVTMSKPIVNAFTYEEQANYIFSVDENKKIKVKVRNIKSKDGKTDYSGDYYLAKIRTGSADYGSYKGQIREGYLCKELQQNDLEFCKYDKKETVVNWNTTVEYVPYYTLKFIHPEADQNSGWKWVDYNQQNNTWNLVNSSSLSPSIAPGVLFFRGNLVVDKGNYINTLIASENIRYGGSTELRAPNYSKIELVCNTVFGMPSNLCSTSAAFTPNGIGNIALLAGSCMDAASPDKCSSTYVGGNITLVGQATIEGNVIAGNKLDTGGSSSIKGSILAAALGKDTGSKLGGSTTIDFNGTTDEQTTITLPSENNKGTGGEQVAHGVKVKWARYI
ncbi:hypothetical protein [Acinetobacter sp.]|jgi:hypothetical protein|uniref:hypothetical protein n=1 Tax=Acinetobacter sp. TaxID=472 RepID=UPI0035B2667A